MSTRRLAWRSDGPPGAPALVLLASVGSTTDMWTPVMAALAEQFRVIRIDHRGHGASPRATTDALPGTPPGPACTLADLGADVVAVLDELGLDRVHLAGLSLGGMVGMWLAAHRPERVARLALLCTSAHLAAATTYTQRAAQVRADGMAVIADAVVARWLTPELADRDPDLVASLRDMVRGVDAESYAQCCEAIASMDLRADLRRIASPTLVIAGEQDPATPPEHAETIAAGIAGARLELLAPAAHVLTYEQAGRAAQLLIDHFRGGATLATGFATRRSVLGDDHVDRTVAATTPLTAPFQQFLTRYAWGDVWSRPELARRERSIATLGALVALGAENEIGLHVRAARRNGLTDSEIAEVVMHVAVYAGVPRANAAMSIVREVLGE